MFSAKAAESITIEKSHITVIAATGPYTDHLHWPQNQLGFSLSPFTAILQCLRTFKSTKTQYNLTVLSQYFRLTNNQKYENKTVKFTHLSLIL